ncbi:MAG TPA: SoxR reducing system RseC family protein [Candidatus Brocadiaceae bacterium]
MFKQELVRERGTVKYIYNNRALVERERPNSKECKSCGVCTGVENTQHLLEVPIIPGLRVGQQVTLEIIKSSPYKSILLILVLPLISIIAGSLLGQKMHFLYPSSPNVRMVSCGFLLFVLSILVISIYDKKIRGQKQHWKIVSTDFLDNFNNIYQQAKLS